MTHFVGICQVSTVPRLIRNPCDKKKRPPDAVNRGRVPAALAYALGRWPRYARISSLISSSGFLRPNECTSLDFRSLPLRHSARDGSEMLTLVISPLPIPPLPNLAMWQPIGRSSQRCGWYRGLYVTVGFMSGSRRLSQKHSPHRGDQRFLVVSSQRRRISSRHTGDSSRHRNVGLSIDFLSQERIAEVAPAPRRLCLLCFRDFTSFHFFMSTSLRSRSTSGRALSPRVHRHLRIVAENSLHRGAALVQVGLDAGVDQPWPTAGGSGAVLVDVDRRLIVGHGRHAGRAAARGVRTSRTRKPSRRRRRRRAAGRSNGGGPTPGPCSWACPSDCRAA